VTLFVDTSVWSFALRRDASASEPEVHALKDALLGRDVIDTTGLVLQELLQGFAGPRASAQIIERFSATIGFGYKSLTVTRERCHTGRDND